MAPEQFASLFRRSFRAQPGISILPRSQRRTDCRCARNDEP